MLRPTDLVADGRESYATDADLLALVTGSERGARQLVHRFKSIADVLQASLGELGDVVQLSVRAALRLRAIAELARRAQTERLVRTEPLCSAAAVHRAYGPRLAHEKREVFLVLHVDAKQRVIGESLIAVGTLTTALVGPREVFSAAVRNASAGLVLIHNHPSGDPEPSREDVAITRRLVEAGALLGINVHDHIVVGADGYVSLAERGLT